MFVAEEQRRDVIQDLALESDSLRGFGIVFAGTREGDDGQVVRLESGIDLEQAIETSGEEAG